MVIETGVVPVVPPPGIEDGVKAQLLFVSVGSAGEKLQLNVTAAAKVLAEVGVAVKL
jgi:hypothetical protein